MEFFNYCITSRCPTKRNKEEKGFEGYWVNDLHEMYPDCSLESMGCIATGDYIDNDERVLYVDHLSPEDQARARHMAGMAAEEEVQRHAQKDKDHARRRELGLGLNDPLPPTPRENTTPREEEVAGPAAARPVPQFMKRQETFNTKTLKANKRVHTDARGKRGSVELIQGAHHIEIPSSSMNGKWGAKHVHDTKGVQHASAKAHQYHSAPVAIEV